MHAAGELLDRDVLDRADRPDLDRQIGERLGDAEQGVARGALVLGQRGVLVLALVDAAGEKLALARAARAVAAAVGEVVALAQGGREHRFPFGNLENVPARLDGDLMRHRENRPG